MLAQRQIYAGKFHEALCVAYKLQDYEEYIPESDIYSLLALASCLDRAFATCSRAFMKLQTLENVSIVFILQFYFRANFIFVICCIQRILILVEPGGN